MGRLKIRRHTCRGHSGCGTRPASIGAERRCAARPGAVDTRLVHVVAQVHDELEVLVRQVRDRESSSHLLVLAGGKCRTGADPRRVPLAGRCACDRRGADSLPAGTGTKTIGRPEPLYVDVHGVGVVGAGRCGPAPRPHLCSGRRSRPPTRRRPSPTACRHRSSGSGASRVQSTTPWGVGSPDATPRLNGGPEIDGAGAVVDRAAPRAAAAVAAAPGQRQACARRNAQEPAPAQLVGRQPILRVRSGHGRSLREGVCLGDLGYVLSG